MSGYRWANYGSSSSVHAKMARGPEPVVYSYKVIKEYPHATDAFTQVTLALSVAYQWPTSCPVSPTSCPISCTISCTISSLSLSALSCLSSCPPVPVTTVTAHFCQLSAAHWHLPTSASSALFGSLTYLTGSTSGTVLPLPEDTHTPSMLMSCTLAGPAVWS